MERSNYWNAKFELLGRWQTVVSVLHIITATVNLSCIYHCASSSSILIKFPSWSTSTTYSSSQLTTISGSEGYMISESTHRSLHSISQERFLCFRKHFKSIHLPFFSVAVQLLLTCTCKTALLYSNVHCNLYMEGP